MNIDEEDSQLMISTQKEAVDAEESTIEETHTDPIIKTVPNE